MKGARIAVITGASSGLGRAFALETGRLGGIDEIWLIARRRDNLERLAGELPVKGRALSLDLLARFLCIIEKTPGRGEAGHCSSGK